MDIKTAILGIVLIAISVFPIVLISRSGKKQKNSMIKSIKRIANQNNCEINFHEICSDFIIGIDDNKNHVFFYKKSNENIIEEVVNLAHYKSCQVEKKKRALKGSNNFLELEKLELLFLPNSNEKNTISFEFYNYNSARQKKGGHRQ